MTKKDYEVIASVLFKAQQEGGVWEERVYLVIWNLAEKIADELAKENPRFNKDKFMEACGF